MLCLSDLLSFRLTVRLSTPLSVSAWLSFRPSVCLGVWICLSAPLSVSVSEYVFPPLNLSLSVCLSVFPTFCPSDCLLTPLSVFLTVFLRLCFRLSLRLSLSVCLSVSVWLVYRRFETDINVCFPAYASVCVILQMFVRTFYLIIILPRLVFLKGNKDKKKNGVNKSLCVNKKNNNNTRRRRRRRRRRQICHRQLLTWTLFMIISEVSALIIIDRFRLVREKKKKKKKKKEKLNIEREKKKKLNNKCTADILE